MSPGTMSDEAHRRNFPWKWTECSECGTAMRKHGNRCTCSATCRTERNRRRDAEWNRRFRAEHPDYEREKRIARLARKKVQ